MKQSRKNIVLIAFVLAALTVLIFVMQKHGYFELAKVHEMIDELRVRYEHNKAAAIILYCASYTLFMVTCIPIGNPLAIAAGAVFGLPIALTATALSGAVGYTGQFLLSRHFFKETISKKLGKRLKPIQDELGAHAALYLIGLRTAQVVPYPLVTFAMSLAPVSALTFFTATLIGQIPVSFIYVNAGTTFVSIRSVGEILTLRVMLTFAGLAIIPLAIAFFKRTHVRDKKSEPPRLSP